MDEYQFEVYLVDDEGDDYSKIIVAPDARSALVAAFTGAKEVIDLDNLSTIECNIL